MTHHTNDARACAHLGAVTDEQIVEIMRAHLDKADGGYVCDISPEAVVEGVRDVLARQSTLRCPGNIFGAHRFEPRYDERPNERVSTLFDGLDRACARTARAMIDGNTIRTYVCDVCVRCGAMVKREGAC
ncbi:hypothetical protein [Burkholderia stabilis]